MDLKNISWRHFKGELIYIEQIGLACQVPIPSCMTLSREHCIRQISMTKLPLWSVLLDAKLCHRPSKFCFDAKFSSILNFFVSGFFFLPKKSFNKFFLKLESDEYFWSQPPTGIQSEQGFIYFFGATTFGRTDNSFFDQLSLQFRTSLTNLALGYK